MSSSFTKSVIEDTALRNSLLTIFLFGKVWVSRMETESA
jgi:hypothetical protein